MRSTISCSPMYLPIICQRLDYCPTPKAQCIMCVEPASGVPLAGVVYDAYNGQIVMAHIWIEDGFMPSKEWFCAIFDYPFNKMGAGKIIGQVNSFNAQARKLDEHFGFTLECQIDNFYINGGSLMIYTMTKEQCLVLNSPKWASVMERVSRA